MSTAVRSGLIIAALLGVTDLAALLLGGGEFPPVEVAIASMILGAVTLIGVTMAWRGSRAGIATVVASRLLSALSALPAFVIEGVPAPAKIAAGGLLVLTVVAIALAWPGMRTRVPVG